MDWQRCDGTSSQPSARFTRPGSNKTKALDFCLEEATVGNSRATGCQVAKSMLLKFCHCQGWPSLCDANSLMIDDESQLQSDCEKGLR